MDENLIVAIYIADSAGARMKGRTKVNLLKGKGIEGDRYANGTGAWSKAGDVIRHVTIISGEEIRAANRAHKTTFAIWDIRRNIVVSDFDVYQLIDNNFRIGDVELRGVAVCDPCDRPSKLSHKPGFKEVFENGGGIRAEVLSSGIIQVGSRLLLL